MATASPITQQVRSSVTLPPTPESQIHSDSDFDISDVEDCLIFNRNGACTTFKSLFQHQKAIIIFVRNADVRLVVIGQSCSSHIEAFCLLTGYRHEIYVDPERHIYKKLGLRRGETYTDTATPSPHVKSSLLVGSMKSMWRAMTSPAFDFQGDPLQLGGAFIIGPGPIVHFAHYDNNRFNHTPINCLLELAGVQKVDFNKR
ncbi:peroxiredoxin-like 2C isoform X1 [Trichomycterus rosablanca]|uniref:peroxiredoxin-like 2C isoform X1 n=1 Tax=Trichomycterus rosablanca TaxID=2290929 RepID=UPI002F35DCA9